MNVQRGVLISSAANRNEEASDCLIHMYKCCYREVCACECVLHTYKYKLRGFYLTFFKCGRALCAGKDQEGAQTQLWLKALKTK